MRNIPHTFRPIEQWPGNFTKDRRRATFKASYASTLDLLDRELWHLGATSVVIEMALNESEIRRDGLPYSNVRTAHPGVIVSFSAKKTGDVKFPCDRFLAWESNLRAIALSLEALRRVDRYGVTRRSEQYRGWAKLPPPGGIVTPMDINTAARVVNAASGNTDRLNRDNYPGIYKRAALKAHPDTGASHETWHQLQQAHDVLKGHFGL